MQKGFNDEYGNYAEKLRMLGTVLWIKAHFIGRIY
jgi:hypothetical protein